MKKIKKYKAILFLFLSIGFLFLISHKDKKIPIAIVTPITHPSLKEIEKGFRETIEAKCPGKYRFVTYNGQGNKTLLRAEVDEILRKGYPLVFTIGALSSQMTKQVFSKQQVDTPIVFTSVSDPIEFDLVDSEELPQGFITGVKQIVDFEQQLQKILPYKPNLRRILLVVNPMEPGMEKDKQNAKLALSKEGIELVTVEVFQTNELMGKVSSQMDRIDAVLVLKDNTVVGGLDVLIKLCNQYHVPLIASDLDSSERGAAFAYGVHEVEFGVEGAKKALAILEEGKSAGKIPVTPVSEFTFLINQNAAKNQGISPYSTNP